MSRRTPDPARRPTAPGVRAEAAARCTELTVQIIPSLADVDPAEWDALAGDDDPFLEHAFLAAFETSRSVGKGTGWDPLHVVVRRAGKLVAAAPLYAKSHSYGEYIFDWGWASAAQRAGIRYYPKLLSAVPFTPATGRRLLVEGGATRGPVFEALLAGIHAVADQLGVSSIHWLFLSADEHAALAERAGFLARTTYQFHFTNPGYASFDDYLGAMRSAARKEVRRERRKAAESGLTLATKRGTELTDAEWKALFRFYTDTAARKGAIAYLTQRFFEEVRCTLPHRVVAALASRGDEPVAGALAFHKGRQLFGRYWGASDDFEALHFELCYYRLIEFAIEHRIARFEAGAQGEHKLKRGLLPSPTYSIHWIRHPGLAEAIAEYLPRETRSVEAEMDYFAEHSPFRRDEPGDCGGGA